MQSRRFTSEGETPRLFIASLLKTLGLSVDLNAETFQDLLKLSVTFEVT